MEHSIQTHKIAFYLNDKLSFAEVRSDETALELLRERLLLRGVKEGCAEGDCGACTIAVGKWENEIFRFRAINSCLFPAIRLHGAHVITVEGLAENKALHPIQQQLLDCHAVQCGYCTPGIVMSMFCLFTQTSHPTERQVKTALEGNLCRCTGYLSILNAASEVSKMISKESNPAQSILPGYCASIAEHLHGWKPQVETTLVANNDRRQTLTYLRPRTMQELSECMQSLVNSEYRFVNGGSDVYVEQNVQRVFAQNILDISLIDELKRIELSGNSICIGGGVTFNALLECDLIQERLPMLCEAAQLLGSHQIRQVATLAGNVAHASPIADGSVALLAYEAKLKLFSIRGIRTIPIDKFFLDYRKTALASDEIIQSIEIPIHHGFASFWKSSKRVAVDIASVNSAMTATMSNGRIESCRFAFGGIAKTPSLCFEISQILTGNPVTNELIETCQNIALQTHAPISDVRGSAEFRQLLIRNHVHYHLSKLQESKDNAGGIHE